MVGKNITVTARGWHGDGDAPRRTDWGIMPLASSLAGSFTRKGLEGSEITGAGAGKGKRKARAVGDGIDPEIERAEAIRQWREANAELATLIDSEQSDGNRLLLLAGGKGWLKGQANLQSSGCAPRAARFIVSKRGARPSQTSLDEATSAAVVAMLKYLLLHLSLFDVDRCQWGKVEATAKTYKRGKDRPLIKTVKHTEGSLHAAHSINDQPVDWPTVNTREAFTVDSKTDWQGIGVVGFCSVDWSEYLLRELWIVGWRAAFKSFHSEQKHEAWIDWNDHDPISPGRFSLENESLIEWQAASRVRPLDARKQATRAASLFAYRAILTPAIKNKGTGAGAAQSLRTARARARFVVRLINGESVGDAARQSGFASGRAAIKALNDQLASIRAQIDRVDRALIPGAGLLLSPTARADTIRAMLTRNSMAESLDHAVDSLRAARRVHLQHKAQGLHGWQWWARSDQQKHNRLESIMHYRAARAELSGLRRMRARFMRRAMIYKRQAQRDIAARAVASVAVNAVKHARARGVSLLSKLEDQADRLESKLRVAKAEQTINWDRACAGWRAGWLRT